MRRALLIFIALVSVPRAAWPQAGMPLGPEFRANTYTTSVQNLPSVASDSSGNFVIVWTSFGQDDSLGGIFAQRYASSGTPLGPEFLVNTYTSSHQGTPDVAADASGNFVVVWNSGSQDGSGGGIFGQRYSSSGVALGPEFRVNTYTASDQFTPTVAADSSGNFVVVWGSYTQDGAGGSGIFGQRYASSGVSLGPEFRINTFTTNSQYGPSIAADAAGNFVVVWASQGQDSSASGVFGQRYANTGVPLGPEFRVNTVTTNNQNGPSVASDATGNMVVVWRSQDQDGSDGGVFGQRYANSGAPAGPEFRVNTYTPGAQQYPSVAADSAGNFVVVWTSAGQDGSSDGVFGQRYSSAGATFGPEFRVNTYTTDVQSHPAVAASPLGNFVITWDSNTQDGSNYGVFGQRYGQIVPVELMHFGIE